MNLNQKFLIIGSEFYSKYKFDAINNLKGQYQISDFFNIRNEIISISTQDKYMLYDLTHSLSNFLIDGDIVKTIGSNKKLAYKDDFVISRLRSYLKELAVVEDKEFEQLFSTEYLIYKNINNKLSSNTLLVFALSKYVQTILNKSQYGTQHPRFYEFAFEDITIPNNVINLNDTITSIIDISKSKLEQSVSPYKIAESLLLKELNLNEFQESKENISKPKMLSEVLSNNIRFDSEYYLPRYNQILKKLENYNGGFDSIENLCTLLDKNYKPTDNTKYKYIELSNIDSTGNIRGYSYEIGQNLPSRARRKIQENDVIVSSIEGSIDKVALVSKEFNNSLCSTGFYVLNSNVINSETLLVLFKNKTIQQLLKQKCSGTILMGMNKVDFLDIHLPIISLSIQNKIKIKINESFILKEQSKELLELAKDIMQNAINNKKINLKDIDSKVKLICGADNKS